MLLFLGKKLLNYWDMMLTKLTGSQIQNGSFAGPR